MKKNYSFRLPLILLMLNLAWIGSSKAQTASTTIVYSGFQSCGGCTVCGADYYCFNTISSYCGNTAACNTRTFTDPVPPGNIVTSVTVNYFSAQCSGGSLAATINGNSVPTVNEANTGCPCSASPCGQSASSSSNFPCGLPGYVNGGTNSLQLCTGSDVCINRLQLVFTYAPANQASPAVQPSSVVGPTNVCVGQAQTFSCAPVSNAASYDWTVPPGWTINSGQGTNVISATPGTSGNICVRAQNLCGNSAYTCLPVNLSTNSTPPTGASASPNPVCGNVGTTLSLSGGSLGVGAGWEWYSGSCGGSLVGTGPSVSVSPGTTTTYYVRAVGSCNTTACASVVFTVNPVPTANAGQSKVINCLTTSTVLTGSGGSSYSWTGPGIVSGGSTANPTVNQPGTYSLVVTNAGCPSAVATVLVTQDNTPPSVASGVSGTLNCNVTSVNVNASTATTPVSYNWTGPGITGGSGTGTITVNQPGTYNYTVTNTSNGCSTTGSQVVTQNSGGPSVTVSSSNAITCSNSTSQVIASTASSPVSFTWSGPGVVSGANTATANVNAGGQYIVIVQNTTSMCSTTMTVSVASNTAATIPVITPSGSITCTSPTVTLSSTPASGVTYTWTGTGIIGNPNAQNINVNQSGVYTLSVTNSDGCVGSASANVSSNNSTPGITLGTASTVTTTCANPNATLTASSPDDPNVTYTWLTPSSTTITGNPINPTGAGVYTVVVTNTITGCSSSSTAAQATVEVIADAGTPVVSLSANTLSITCTNSTVTLTASTTSNPVTYSWSPVSGIIPGTETTANPVFNAAGSYSVVITNTLNGCATGISNHVVSVVTDTNSPVANFSATASSGTLTCSNPSVTAGAGLSGGNYTYTWSPSAGISGSVNQATATFTAIGVYTVSITNTITGCVSSATNSSNTFTVSEIRTVPLISISAISSNSTIGCGGTNSLVTLEATTNPSNSLISWLPGGSNTAQLNVNASGTYSLIATHPTTGCSDTTDYVVSGNTNPPQYVDAGTTVFIPCNSQTVALTGTSATPNCTYVWTGPSPTAILSGSTTTFPIVGEAGIYTLTVTRNDNGCQATATVSVVHAVVNAAFSADPTSGTSPLTVNFTDATTGASNWSWNFGDGSPLVVYFPTSQNPVNVYPTGTYTVTLIASSGICTDTASMVIIVEDGLSLEIPNVFTPNDDDANDVFTIHSTGIKEITLQIFNRWGEGLYEFTGPKASWDGLAPNGTLVPEGTYFYFVKATGIDDTVIERKGTLNLFR